MKNIKNNKEYTKRFMNGFKMLTNTRVPYEVWKDLMLLYAIEIANTALRMFKDKESLRNIWESREKQYIETIKKYNKKEQKIIAQMFTLFVLELEERPDQDLLGEIYMMLEIGNKKAGQFFTPYSVCEAMADVTLRKSEIAQCVKEKGYATIYDCACGAGATLVSATERCKKLFKKLNYQNHIMVIGQDIDIMCVYMSYIQLSLHGMSGFIVHGNTLTEPEVTDLKRIWFMPLYFNNLWTMRRLFHGQDILGRTIKREEKGERV